METTNVVNYSNVEKAKLSEVKESKISKGHVIYASIVAFFAWVFSTYDFILFGTLLPIISKEFHWTTAQSAGIATWVSLATLVIALTVGPITDYFGRRNALMITTAGAALSSGLTGFTMSALFLIIVRAFSGLGFQEQAVNTTYLSELLGAKNVVSFTVSFRVVGLLVFCLLLL